MCSKCQQYYSLNSVLYSMLYAKFPFLVIMFSSLHRVVKLLPIDEIQFSECVGKYFTIYAVMHDFLFLIIIFYYLHRVIELLQMTENIGVTVFRICWKVFRVIVHMIFRSL